MPRNIAPGTVSSEKDLVEYYVEDASPVDAASPSGYVERHIHSEIYKRHTSLQSVAHSHSLAVVPYTIAPVPLRPCFHMAAFLGSEVPNFDIAQHYDEGDVRDLLVRNNRLGAALASCLSGRAAFQDGPPGSPDRCAVLMRGHGYTVVGSSIEECVLRAIYTSENATIQTTSAVLGMASSAGSQTQVDVQYLRDDELEPATKMTKWSYMRPWNLWLREVESIGLYVNKAE